MYDLRTLPHSLDAEKALLGAVLINPAGYDLAVAHVKAEQFFRRAHQTIFEAIGHLSDAGIGVDLVTLADHLGRAGELDECGGPPYIASLTDGVPRSTSVVYYAGIVREKAQLREIIRVATEALAKAYDAAESAADVIDGVDRDVLKLQRGDAGTFLDMRTRGSAVMAMLEDREKKRGQLAGVTTGFQTLDLLTSGWQAGDMIVIAARPSIGKTAFILNTAVAAALAGSRVAVFSLEMRNVQLENRLLASLARVPLNRIREGYFGEGDYDNMARAIGELDALPILLNDRGGQSVWDIRAACRRLRADGGLGLVVVDYIQLMHGTVERRGATRNDELTDISRRLKILADEVQAPILVVSQLNRGAADRADPRPKLSDLRDCGALEQDADAVIFLHRKSHRSSGPTELIVEKQRNGPTGTVNLAFSGDLQRFEDQGIEPEQPDLPAAEPAKVEKRKTYGSWRKR